MKKTTKGQAERGKGSRWLTTDDEERALRQERAHEEPMRVRPLGLDRGEVFQDYEVTRTDADDPRPYQVELRSLSALDNTCTCPDFQKSFLGTCKHIERVLMGVPQRKRAQRADASRVELFMTREPYAPLLRMDVDVPGEAARTLLRHVDEQGRLRTSSATALATLIEACEGLLAQEPDAVRISWEVRSHLQTLQQHEQLNRVRESFRQEMVAAQGAMPYLKLPLYPYQIDGVLHLAFKGRAMLADEMGLGKTVQAVAAASVMREIMGVKRVLVVAPASLKAEWEEQIQTFTTFPLEVLFGARHVRLQRYARTSAFFLIANYEQVMVDFNEINSVFKPDLVILDEAQRIKNWRTKTAQRLKRLESRFAFVLTGTPLENRVDELYSLAEFIDPSLFGSLFRFNRRFFRFDAQGKVAGLQNLDEMHERIGTVMLRRRKDDIEEQLPERIDNTYFVSMTAEQNVRYAEYETVVARLYHLAKQRPLRRVEMDRLQQALACMRMCCDTCYILDETVRDAPKLDELEKILMDLWSSDPQRKVLVFSEWVRMLELVAERLARRKIGYAMHVGKVPQKVRRQEILRFKNDPDCRIFLSSESGGVGLNLQAASVVVNLDLPWNPAKLEQRVARAWRKHQRNRVNVINLVSENTLEHRMLATLKFKQGLADVVLDARGETSVFEQDNPRGAFMARLAEVMDTSLRVASAKPEPKVAELPVDKRLAGALAVENPGIGLCLARYDETGEMQGVLAVGHEGAATVLHKQVEQTHGVALPQNRVVVISPETRALLARLAELGFITLQTNATKTILDLGTDEPPAPPDHARRIARAQEALDAARRQIRMAGVLAEGGFAEEAASAAREAVCRSTGVLALFAAGIDAETSLYPLTDAVVAAVKGDASVERGQVAVMQAAHLDLETEPEARLELAQAFIDYSGEELGKRRMRVQACGATS